MHITASIKIKGYFESELPMLYTWNCKVNFGFLTHTKMNPLSTEI